MTLTYSGTCDTALIKKDRKWVRDEILEKGFFEVRKEGIIEVIKSCDFIDNGEKAIEKVENSKFENKEGGVYLSTKLEGSTHAELYYLYVPNPEMIKEGKDKVKFIKVDLNAYFPEKSSLEGHLIYFKIVVNDVNTEEELEILEKGDSSGDLKRFREGLIEFLKEQMHTQFEVVEGKKE